MSIVCARDSTTPYMESENVQDPAKRNAWDFCWDFC